MVCHYEIEAFLIHLGRKNVFRYCFDFSFLLTGAAGTNSIRRSALLLLKLVVVNLLGISLYLLRPVCYRSLAADSFAYHLRKPLIFHVTHLLIARSWHSCINISLQDVCMTWRYMRWLYEMSFSARWISSSDVKMNRSYEKKDRSVVYIDTTKIEMTS